MKAARPSPTRSNYILTTISASFGHMFSMAGASLLLPFLPLLAPQVLLENFLSDIPSTTIAGDNVDVEMLQKAPPLEYPSSSAII